MPRYFFHLHECGTITPDVEGQELLDDSAAQVEALRLARNIMAGEIEGGRLCLLCRIEVHDAQGTMVMAMPFKDAVVVTGL
ncbi:DUF6894 family protein [Sphingobium boeckii]|uniref:DUF6894 domain-containing protein n=1 Tax=Sphingobium boeckii TaxID=1082345 RepID=A0A7W9AL55_9SPHN|nr:hypothetical protein [Sphingobium boeckii]MBB5687462.1 hypothetical protein [Sphingobium boeckii]